MSVLTSLGIVIVVLLIVALMQLTPSVFLLFSHHAFGKFSKNRASDLVLFFILGAETMLALLLVVIYFVFNSLLSFFNINNAVLAWALGGILIALGILYFLFYYKRGKNTELFISRKCANSFHQKIGVAKTRSDAFLLGMIALIPELMFTLPVYIVMILEVMRIGGSPLARSGLLFLVILVALLPLIVIHVLFNTGHNLANIQKMRVKNKMFLRFVVSILYLMLAALVITEAMIV